jgi:threonine dehydrogenase-like Zn-dependent dehydrogenase
MTAAFSSSWILGTSVALVVAAIGILLSTSPSPDLEWQTVVIPSAVEYMEKAMKVEIEEEAQPQKPLRGMIIAVTGATSGIGLGLTRKLSSLGATVIAIGRSREKLQQLQEELQNVETVLANFSDLESIAQASQYMVEHYNHLDVLVNNAGIHTGLEGMIQSWTSKQGYDLPFAGMYL